MIVVILDMYGVILKDPEGGFIPFVNQTFPDLTRADIYKYWDKADVGELASLDLFRELGFKGDLGKIEKKYLDTVEIDESFYTRNVQYEDKTANNFEELAKMLINW